MVKAILVDSSVSYRNVHNLIFWNIFICRLDWKKEKKMKIQAKAPKPKKNYWKIWWSEAVFEAINTERKVLKYAGRGGGAKMKKRLCKTCFYYEGKYPYGDCVSPDMEFEVYTNIPLSVKWDKDDMHVIQCDSYKEKK